MKVIILTFLLASCGRTVGNGESVPPYNEPMIATLDGDVPPEANLFAANITLENFSQEQEEKLWKAVELVKKVIASKEFKDEVINHRYNGLKTFSNNNGLSNLQIYNKILWGAEVLQPNLNHTMDVTLELYFQSSNTIGYTYPNTTKIWMNTKYFDNFTPYRVSDNLFHEWLHKLGFGHDVSPSAARPYSVPYAVGSIVSRLAQQLDSDL